MHILLHGSFGSELARLRIAELRERASRDRRSSSGRRRSLRRPPAASTD